MSTPLASQISPELLAVATSAERQAIELALRKEQALLSPLDFACYINPEQTVRYRHTELLNRYALALIEHELYPSGIGTAAEWTPAEDDPEDGRWLHPVTGEEAHDTLVLSVPPQHGKSYIITETAPAWYLIKYPERRCVVTAYEADFARTFGRKNREKIQKVPEFGIELNPNTRAADEWDLQGTSGGMVTAGSGGPITGKGAHLMIVDDPVKNSEDALSAAARKKNWDWWKSTVTSRMRAGGVKILIQTRWHEGDLAGVVSEKERCYVLNIPALAFDEMDEEGFSIDPDTGERDPLNRKPGQALCPELHPRSKLLARQEVNDDNADEPGGMLWFSALYQGKPNIEGGGILAKPYRYFRSEQDPQGNLVFITKDLHGKTKRFLNGECIRFITSDLATSLKTRADYTVFSSFAWTPDGDILVLEQHRERLESPDHPDEAERFFRRQTDKYGSFRFFGIENKTFGQSLFQTLVRKGDVPVLPLEADADKVARAIPVGMRIKADRFFLPEGADWLKNTEKEMQIFPNGTHDDVVDTFGYAVSASMYFPIRKAEVDVQPRRPEDAVAKKIEALSGKRKGRKRHGMLGRF